MYKETGIVSYYRPKTRGELKEKLADGIECEVVSSDVDITVALLAWLDCFGFSVRLSENKGWSVFVPDVGIVKNTDV